MEKKPEVTHKPEIQITEAESRKDIFYIVREWSHYFGVEYDYNQLPYELAYILGWTSDDDPVIDAHALIAKTNEIPIGCAVASIHTKSDVLEFLPKSKFDPEKLVTDPVGWLPFSAVDPSWRCHGIGKRLFSSRLKWLSQKDISVVMGMGWERETESSRPLFEQAGFQPIQRFPNYYESDQSSRTACPDCGSWPSNNKSCHCSMTLWAIDLDQ